MLVVGITSFLQISEQVLTEREDITMATTKASSKAAAKPSKTVKKAAPAKAAAKAPKAAKPAAKPAAKVARTAKAATPVARAAATKAAPKAAARTTAARSTAARTTAAKAAPRTARSATPATVTLKHLAAELSVAHELTKKHAEEILNDMIGLVVDNLKKGARIRINGLGILQVRKRAARMGRNPATGEQIKIKASKKVAFRPTKDLKEAI